MDPKKDLLEIIEKSDLFPDDKKMWEDLIGRAPEDFAFSILDALSKDAKELGWFNDLYKRKNEVFKLAKADPEKAKLELRKILEEEKNKMQELNGKK